uniref:Uncharacterized protein n=1 Tax=Zea mays TaxID=4577 RepID=C4J556_MAIZE|nr:unknown [Zea mays]
MTNRKKRMHWISLAGEGAGVVDEEGAAAEDPSEGDGPDQKPSGSTDVDVAGGRPVILVVDWAVSVDVRAVLVDELVHALALALSPVGVDVDGQATPNPVGLVGLDLLLGADDGEGGGAAAEGRQALRRHRQS